MPNTIKAEDFDLVKLKLASPEKILSWSHGEVIRPETINYRTQRAEKDGLFCERIFGPTKDWECFCGKYKKIRYKGIVCERCGVEVTRAIVRRERMGHIKLKTPVTHIWFLKGIPSKIGLLLNLSTQSLEKVIYFANFIITNVDEGLKKQAALQIKEEFKTKKKQIENEFNKKSKEVKNSKSKLINGGESLSKIEKQITEQLENLEKERDNKIAELKDFLETAEAELKELAPLKIISEHTYQTLSLKYGYIFEAGIGAEAIKQLLEKIDLEKLIKELKSQLKKLKDAKKDKKDKIIKRIKLAESLKVNKIRPEWMVLTVIPVIPPELRPMVPLDGGRFATSDLNDLYRRVINRNNRLQQLIDLNAPEVIRRNEKRMLQEAVDALIDNSARHTKTTFASTGQRRSLKSLADALKGKQGRFRRNLLGKRVDYSGRSVIVVNPSLKLGQCGLPKKMALELFKPFIISQLIKGGYAHNVKNASKFIEAGNDEVFDILERIIKKSYVLLNRAPTLHRLGIQAFKPILIEGKAIQIHPMVCQAFNADFDGDQMAVHLPLTEEARKECEDIMLSTHNLLKPATGEPIVVATQDIVWGSYYLTMLKDKEKTDEKKLKVFSSFEQVIFVYKLGKVRLHQIIKVRNSKHYKGAESYLITTPGRILFNQSFPDDYPFFNELANKGKLKNIIKQCLIMYGNEISIKIIDRLKSLAFDYVTKSGQSWGMDDLVNFEEKDRIIKKAEEEVEGINQHFEQGFLTKSERYSKIIELWTKAKEDILNVVENGLDKTGPVYSMIDSGARGSLSQLVQIVGMKGLVTSPSGEIIELPVKGNFKQGFNALEYFISSHGVRKGLSDTALRTSNAGYLTRRLIDLAQDIIVNKEDCGDTEGVKITQKQSEEIGKTLLERIIGRYLAADLKNKEGKVLVKAGKLIDFNIADKLKTENIEEAVIRSPLTCKLDKGVCAKCYGWDLGYNKPVKLGTAVGIIAAQSIGEPGTQLTMRTFHTGGVAGGGDITQGLPRVEEIFEARTPKVRAFMADVDGKIKIEIGEKIIKDEKGREIITSNKSDKIIKLIHQIDKEDVYDLNAIANEKNKNNKIIIKIKNGQVVKKDDILAEVGGEKIKAKQTGIAKLDKNKIKIDIKERQIKEFIVPNGYNIWVKDGQFVKKGDRLTDGSLNLQQLYKLKGKLATQKYIIEEIQHIYSSQGQPLNDKHIELIVKQMFSRVYIKDIGDTELFPGSIVEESVFNKANRKAKRQNKKPATGAPLLLGMSKVALSTNSFLSAASFQETDRVLIDAAVSGKVDHLEGLKENVIIGRLIPVGTGFRKKK